VQPNLVNAFQSGFRFHALGASFVVPWAVMFRQWCVCWYRVLCNPLTVPLTLDTRLQIILETDNPFLFECKSSGRDPTRNRKFFSTFAIPCHMKHGRDISFFHPHTIQLPFPRFP
jgi:hypothetical protein